MGMRTDNLGAVALTRGLRKLDAIPGPRMVDQRGVGAASLVLKPGVTHLGTNFREGGLVDSRAGIDPDQVGQANIRIG